MKKFLFFAIAKAMLGMTYTSCDDKKEDLNEEKEKAKEEVKGDSIKGDSIKTDSIKTFSLIGRWDCLPEDAQVGQGEQRLTLIFDSTNVDVYIVAWGDHLRGTYTYENDTLYFSFKNEDAWDAQIIDEYSQGWFVGDGALDPETFYLTYTEEYPYRWYQMDSEVFNDDVQWLSDFEFKFIDENKASGGPMRGMFFIKRDKIEKTILEGKWSHSERYEYPSGYSIRAEGFTFNKNTFVLESSEVGVAQGQSWGYGHKIAGTFTVDQSSFTITVAKFYGFNNDDEPFDWHEAQEGMVGQSYTFRYQFKDDSLMVTPPESFTLGGGSYLGNGQAWYTKESGLKVNQVSYDGRVFNVETNGSWDGRMGWLDITCEQLGLSGTLDHHWDHWVSGSAVDLAADGYPEDFGISTQEDYLIHFYGKEGDLEGTHYDNIFRSGTVTYTGGVTEDKLVFKLDAVLANGKSLKFWLEFERSVE